MLSLDLLKRVDELVEKVLCVFYLYLGENDVFFWISYCSCMLTVILKLSIHMRSVSRALVNLDCAAYKMSSLRQELFFFLVPCGIQEKTDRTPISVFVLIPWSPSLPM